MKPAALLFLMISWFASSVWAEQKVEFDGHELHYIVINSTEIPADIASRYNLTRSGKYAFINLSILKQTDDGYGTAVSADISAIQRSLVGQQSQINLQEIREGDAIYYIGTFLILNREVLWFDINLTVHDGPAFEFSFDQQVWRE